MVAPCSCFFIYNRVGQNCQQSKSICIHIVLCLIDQMLELGWVTLDNASNNNSMMEHLAHLLRRKNIIFNHEDDIFGAQFIFSNNVSN